MGFARNFAQGIPLSVLFNNEDLMFYSKQMHQAGVKMISNQV